MLFLLMLFDNMDYIAEAISRSDPDHSQIVEVRRRKTQPQPSVEDDCIYRSPWRRRGKLKQFSDINQRLLLGFFIAPAQAALRDPIRRHNIPQLQSSLLELAVSRYFASER